MSERLNDRLRRAHELFRRDQDRLRDELMASLPERMPEAAQDPTQPSGSARSGCADRVGGWCLA